MERTKKQEQLIVINLVVFLVLLWGMVLGFFLYLLPQIRYIEEDKKTTLAEFNNLNSIEKNWMTYKEFMEISPKLSSYQEDAYLQEIVNNVKSDFYENNLVNNGESANYKAFLEELEKQTDEWLPIEKKNEIISSVLPVYSEFVSDLWDWTISEFKFINYIEAIMETFRLTFSNQIWIQDVKLVEWYSVWVLDSSLETNIYYIPVNLDLSWTKSDILDFLYFAEHIWKINIEWNDLYIDKTVSNDFESFKTKKLKWQTSSTSSTGSIFSNQMFSIESITFPEYIDSDLVTYDKSKSLISFVKSNLAWWNYKVSVKLRFYVKWLPVYKIENYIREFIWEFNALQGGIDSALKNPSLSSSDKQKLDNLNTAISQFSKSTLPNIQQWLSLENINEGYNLVNRYYPTIKAYKATLEQINTNLLWNIVK